MSDKLAESFNHFPIPTLSETGQISAFSRMTHDRIYQCFEPMLMAYNLYRSQFKILEDRARSSAKDATVNLDDGSEASADQESLPMDCKGKGKAVDGSAGIAGSSLPGDKSGIPVIGESSGRSACAASASEGTQSTETRESSLDPEDEERSLLLSQFMGLMSFKAKEHQRLLQGEMGRLMFMNSKDELLGMATVGARASNRDFMSERVLEKEDELHQCLEVYHSERESRDMSRGFFPKSRARTWVQAGEDDSDRGK
ncbi:hypothetical protein BGX31_003681, partial [Mortierella sp. GBA43]